MQLWVIKLNKRKGRISLVILSVALVLALTVGVATAWFTHVNTAKSNAGMYVETHDIFAYLDDNGQADTFQYIPGKKYSISHSVRVGMTADDYYYKDELPEYYSVFMQISQSGGDSTHRYLDYEFLDDTGYVLLSSEQITAYGFPERANTEYYWYARPRSNTSFTLFAASTDRTVFEPFTANPKTTYEQVQALKVTGQELKFSVVAAGLYSDDSDMPTVEEAMEAELYTAFL